MGGSGPLPAVAPHDIGAAAHDLVARWVGLGAGLVVAIATWALFVITTGMAWYDWLDPAWICGVLTAAAVDAIRPDDRPPRYLPWLVWSMPLVVAGFSLWGTLTLWETAIETSLWLATATFWWLVRETPHRMHTALRRLDDRRVLDGHAGTAGELSRNLDRVANRWALAGGGCIFAVGLTTVALQPGLVEWLSHTGLVAVGFYAAVLTPFLLVAFVVGAWAGRMAANGRVGALIRRQGHLRVIPGHPDGAGGLRPLGALFLYQSLVAAVPAIYLASFLAIFTVERAVDPYTMTVLWSLLGISILIEMLTFAAPMRSIHEIMQAEKEHELWRESDSLSRQIEEVRSRLREADVSGRGDQESRLAAMISRFEALEATPTWPVDATIRRRFTLQNLGLLLPFVGYIVGERSLLEGLSNLFADH